MLRRASSTGDSPRCGEMSRSDRGDGSFEQPVLRCSPCLMKFLLAILSINISGISITYHTSYVNKLYKLFNKMKSCPEKIRTAFHFAQIYCCHLFAANSEHLAEHLPNVIAAHDRSLLLSIVPLNCRPFWNNYIIA